ncbi:hypothetical protein KK101_17030 [Curtobacterium flaccumfaciens pv. oortii]|uniref:hypothetical protein n=1 Tax=Curtobacterium flaccumfaciens TaxID=2035 RepID=UPI001BDDE113|nr:hypothetical protein [Curtobacterium flaccumfaciens]MBT1624402.1 hypothetical protein [Curtobacterium flaccumfaciens pv. oortii]
MIDDNHTTHPSDATDPVRGAALTGAAPDRQSRDLCFSVFDRWRCGLAEGHAGHHESVAGAVARWSDRLAGRRLKDL